eukprot:TRINITY_DN22681_c0_g1_i2.p1 TRINITY_DN22681_c0_g1~~TRINITY_DN22681_c0_g1_i2.p1  ORF type:complete len:428 (-),score=112.39 TRINITY_DN22681_c0_g1_i2:40-1323(-)
MDQTALTEVPAGTDQGGEEWEQVLDFWFGGDLKRNYTTKWFPQGQHQQAADAQVLELFESTLHRAEDGSLDHWRGSVRGSVGLVIVLDQFSRHVYRKEEQRERIDRNDMAALPIAEALLDELPRLPVAMHVFALMPLRHSPTIDRLRMVMEHMDRRSQQEQAGSDLIKRFVAQTTRRLQDLEGKAVPSSTGAYDILEFSPFDADPCGIKQHKLSKTIKAFLKEFKPPDVPAVAISLSGGVDSMVVAKILKVLQDDCGPRFEVVAIHIDYGNRDESKAEAEFLERWCAEQGITFEIRTIAEVKRGVTNREEYEVISREIRFDMYKKCRARHLFSGVCVGHHQGDVQENVLSNLMKGRSLLELHGMSRVSTNNGVNIWRPLLPHVKDDIFGSVSYTHLRAHETPEHLVCRLLLEKKKKIVRIKKYDNKA